MICRRWLPSVVALALGALLPACGTTDEPVARQTTEAKPNAPLEIVQPQSAAARLPDVFNELERKLPALLGGDFACVVAPEQWNARLLVYVRSSDKARGRARRRIAQLGRSGFVTIRVAPVEQLDSLRRDLLRRLRRSAPPGLAGIDTESTVGRETCPRSVIYLRADGQTSDSTRRWAADMQKRFGTDRLSIDSFGVIDLARPG